VFDLNYLSDSIPGWLWPLILLGLIVVICFGAIKNSLSIISRIKRAKPKSYQRTLLNLSGNIGGSIIAVVLIGYKDALSNDAFSNLLLLIVAVAFILYVLAATAGLNLFIEQNLNSAKSIGKNLSKRQTR